MESDVKTMFDLLAQGQRNLCNKIDTNIKHQKEMCTKTHEPINSHLKDGMYFRDKLVSMGGWVKANWTVTVILLIGFLGVAWFAIQKLLAG